MCFITRDSCLGEFSASVHVSMTNMLFLFYSLLNHQRILFSSHTLNMLLCDIFKQNVCQQTNTSTTFQFLIIHIIVKLLEDRALLGSTYYGEGDRDSDVNRLA